MVLCFIMSKIKEQEIKQIQNYNYEYLVAFSIAMSTFSIGTGIVWTSPTLPILYSDSSPIPITTEEGSWIATISLIARVVTPIPGAWLMDNIGRKKTILIGTLPMIVAWILILFADSVLLIYISRFMCGIATGLIQFTVVPIYLGEIASDKIRGTILSIIAIFAKLGFLYTYAIGPFVSMYTMAWILLIPPIIFFLLFSWSPETPYYLIGKNKHDEALKSLIYLRRRVDVTEEYLRIKEAVELTKEKRVSYKEMLSTDNRRSLYVMLLLAFGSQACGNETVMIYSGVIFHQIASDFLEPIYTNIIFGIVFLIGSIISSFLIDRIGRRKLLLSSVIVICASHTVLTIFFNFQKNHYDVQFISWLPACALILFIFGVGVGLGSMFFSYIGEIFAKHMKGIAGIIFTIVLAASSFGFSKLFQYMTENYGYDSMFGIFAGFAFIYIPIFWWILPETNGKPLAVILDELKNVKTLASK